MLLTLYYLPHPCLIPLPYLPAISCLKSFICGSHCGFDFVTDSFHLALHSRNTWSIECYLPTISSSANSFPALRSSTTFPFHPPIPLADSTRSQSSPFLLLLPPSPSLPSLRDLNNPSLLQLVNHGSPRHPRIFFNTSRDGVHIRRGSSLHRPLVRNGFSSIAFRASLPPPPSSKLIVSLQTSS